MVANDDVDDEAMRLWLADGKAPQGICPHCGSTVSVVQHGGFRARCSHRRCGASGPLMRTITRAVDAFYRPPGYVERHMGIHPSSLTDVVSTLEARAEQAEAEVARLRGELSALEDGRHEDLPAAFAAVRQAALRQAAGVLRRLRDDAGGLYVRAAYVDGERAILRLIDAAPAAEGGEP